jgi:hypothetical protein
MIFMKELLEDQAWVNRIIAAEIGVQSRHLIERVLDEFDRLICPVFADKTASVIPFSVSRRQPYL